MSDNDASDEDLGEETLGGIDEVHEPLFAAFFETPREGLLSGTKTRHFRLHPDRISVHRSERDKRAESTIWLRNVAEASLQQLETGPLPCRLHIVTPGRTHKLFSAAGTAREFLDALVRASEHAAGRGRRYSEPLGLQSAVLHYSRYADAAAAASGAKPVAVARTAASGGASKDAVEATERSHKGTLQVARVQGGRVSWRQCLGELTHTGVLKLYNVPRASATTLTAAARTRILATKGGPALQLVGAALHLVKGEGAPQHTAFFAPPLLPNLSFKGASSHNKLS